MFDNGTSFNSNENQNLIKTSIKKEETVKDIKTETSNENISENSEENTAKKSNNSFITVFSDEELYGIKKEIEEAESEDEEEKPLIENADAEGEDESLKLGNFYTQMQAEIERILTRKDFEDIIFFMVDTLLDDEKRALSEKSKQEIKLQKFILGVICLRCNAPGPQKNFMTMMAERLGVKYY